MAIANMPLTFANYVNLFKEGVVFLKHHNSKQIMNAANYVLRSSIQKYPIHVPWNPVWVTIVIESKCNYTCEYCLWHSRDTKRPYMKLHLSFDDFKRMVDILYDNHIAHIHLCATGEIFFNPEVFEMIAYVREKGMTCSIMTNAGSQMSSLVEKIADSGIDRFHTNIESGFPQEHEAIRKNSDWSVTIDNLRRLAELKKNKYKIYVDVMAMKSNHKSYKELMKICADIGVDEVFFSYLQPMSEDVAHGMNAMTSKDNMIQPDDNDILEYIGAAIALGRRMGLKVYEPRFPKFRNTVQDCSTLWWKLMINLPHPDIPEDKWIGNVSSNCMLTHFGGAISYGNMFDTPFKDIWNGEIMKEYRKMLLSNAPEVCQKCPSL